MNHNSAAIIDKLAVATVACITFATAHAQTVYDARRQLFGSMIDSTCTLIGYSGQDSFKAKNKGASLEQTKEKATQAIQQKYQGNRDLMKMAWATADRVYARPVKTWQDAHQIGYEYCIQYMDSMSPY